MPSPTWMQSLQALPFLCSPSPLVPKETEAFCWGSVLHPLGLQLVPLHGGKWNMGSWHHFLSLACTVIISGKRLLLSGLSEWVTLTSDYLTVKCLPNFRPQLSDRGTCFLNAEDPSSQRCSLLNVPLSSAMSRISQSTFEDRNIF